MVLERESNQLKLEKQRIEHRRKLREERRARLEQARHVKTPDFLSENNIASVPSGVVIDNIYLHTPHADLAILANRNKEKRNNEFSLRMNIPDDYSNSYGLPERPYVVVEPGTQIKFAVRVPKYLISTWVNGENAWGGQNPNVQSRESIGVFARKKVGERVYPFSRTEADVHGLNASELPYNTLPSISPGSHFADIIIACEQRLAKPERLFGKVEGLIINSHDTVPIIYGVDNDDPLEPEHKYPEEIEIIVCSCKEYELQSLQHSPLPIRMLNSFTPIAKFNFTLVSTGNYFPNMVAAD